VQPQIAQFTSVCSYDRAGIGYSDTSSRPRTSKVMAEELHALFGGGGNCTALHSRRPFAGRIQCSTLCQPVSQRGRGHGAGRRFPSRPGESFPSGA
jgi:hypothetical protein